MRADLSARRLGSRVDSAKIMEGMRNMTDDAAAGSGSTEMGAMEDDQPKMGRGGELSFPSLLPLSLFLHIDAD